jgi:multicomponent Na+:H+ antiporter subunit B
MVLLGIMAITGFALVRLRNLFAVVMLSGIFTLTAALLYVVLDAVDVAFTEAAVGAGVVTVLMLGTLVLTSQHEKVHPRRNWMSLLLVCLTGGLLIYGTFDMPGFSDPSAPANHHVIPRYILESGREIGIPNIVTSVLASYRGYDTLGETLVIFTAAIGVLVIIGRTRRRRRGDPGQDYEGPS